MNNQKMRQANYQLPSTDIQLKVLFTENSAWLTEEQIVKLFVSRCENVASKNDKYKAELSNAVTTECVLQYLKDICEDNRYLRYEVSRFFTIPDFTGFLDVGRSQKYYNLDMILAVGYRCDFTAATIFRKWVSEESKNNQVEPSFHRVYNLKLIILILSFVLPILAMTIILFTVEDALVPIISLSIALLVGVSTTAINIMIYNEEKGYKRTKSKS
ncbi:RhuM family protein [Psychrobacter sp. Ps3]|uniref:RhuM family protein n=1 Tax=Psychrobacter sp. Ps3 TaxID=2790957 RepID=UPI001EE0AA61|nr:RhuM family protein [Psychrobacter sp. Ps3]MCG3882277.1 virulence RhuM family protein [Psychrobacter sp. Ps3]